MNLKVNQKNTIRAELCELLKKVEDNFKSDGLQVDTILNSAQERADTNVVEKTETVEFNLNISETQNPVVVENFSSVNENEKSILEEEKLANSKNKKKQKLKSENTPHAPVAVDDTMKRSTSAEYFIINLFFFFFKFQTFYFLTFFLQTSFF